MAYVGVQIEDTTKQRILKKKAKSSNIQMPKKKTKMKSRHPYTSVRLIQWQKSEKIQQQKNLAYKTTHIIWGKNEIWI